MEVAFFGGSFTGLPMEEQSAYLSIAKKYKDAGRVDKIHMSTRPDYIDKPILENLKRFGADVIELGVQSFDDEVLRRSGRGHDSAVVYRSSEMIKDFGFELGIQLMIGLPADSREKSSAPRRKRSESALLSPGSTRPSSSTIRNSPACISGGIYAAVASGSRSALQRDV